MKNARCIVATVAIPLALAACSGKSSTSATDLDVCARVSAAAQRNFAAYRSVVLNVETEATTATSAPVRAAYVGTRDTLVGYSDNDVNLAVQRFNETCRQEFPAATP
jgi:hypothetical protein